MQLNTILLLIFSTILIVGIQGLWSYIIKDFSLSKVQLIFIVLIISLLNGIYTIYFERISLAQICLVIITLILTNLSFTDFKYYEISGKSYWFLIIPVGIYMFVNNIYPFWKCIISGIVMFIILFIIDKLVGIERIGGADVKLLMITSFMFSIYEILIFFMLVFAIDIILFLILKAINLIRTNNEQVKIPMIVAISISVVMLTYLCNFVFYI